MWKNFIANINSDLEFNFPICEKDLLDVEAILNISFPKDLKEFLYESDGLKNSTAIWSIENIKKNNLFLRTSDIITETYMPLDCFLFFGDAGNGDCFAYAIINQSIYQNNIYIWDHENDSRKWIYDSLEAFLKDYLKEISFV